MDCLPDETHSVAIGSIGSDHKSQITLLVSECRVIGGKMANLHKSPAEVRGDWGGDATDSHTALMAFNNSHFPAG